MSSPDALPQPDPDAGPSCRIFPADTFVVDHGLNEGDSLGGPGVDGPGDVFRLVAGAVARRLCLSAGPDGIGQQVLRGGDIGQPGDPVTVEARYTLAARNGARVTLAVVRIGRDLRGAVPLQPLVAPGPYTLLAIAAHGDPLPIGLPLCPGVARGTGVTLACGTGRPVEHLRPGDMVMTAGNGPQPLRWIGRTALPGTGDLAPVAIAAGALGNLRDLIVGPDLRLLPEGLLPAGHAVAARALAGRDGIRRREAPVIEYFALVFDRPEVILVEGIAAESLVVTPDGLHRLPEDLAHDLRRRFPDLSQGDPFGTGAGEADAKRRAPLLRPRGD